MSTVIKKKKPSKVCIIMDWKGKTKKVRVPWRTRVVQIDIISGDMVMTKPVYADSSNDRNQDDFGGRYKIKLSECEVNENGEYLVYDKIDVV